ncbi:DUF998 domain-containing protein [Egicoccus sp. AB-alg2]|uniref:DUF998 domain-containing protein n=1 Tax=Egicoccus sp. AB-alg2 TaxID=3242693 RepID=UPI00359E66DA
MRPGTPLTPGERRLAVAAVVALAWYVTSWAVGGVLEDDYDPADQAISELFDLAASTAPRLLISSGLLVSALGLIGFGWLLHRRLPGSSPLGPAAVVGSGIATGLILAFPCTAGCPGLGTTWTDTGHGVLATVGYGLLVLAPLLIGWRIRPALPVLASWCWALGGAALAVFLVNQAGLLGWGTGIAQRVFNTTADVWYVVAAVWLLRGQHLSAHAEAAGLGRGRDRPPRRQRPGADP